jgi:hypothetical protein
MALERAGCRVPDDATGATPAGQSAARLAASIRPPLGLPAPAFLDESGARDPLAWIARVGPRLPAALVTSKWPRVADRLRVTLEENLVALSACLAGRSDEAAGFAALLPFRTGRAFLAARALWALTLSPDEADALGSLFDAACGGES